MFKEALFLNNNHTPLVSVIIPTYNRSLLLREAIASVKAQTYTNWELIIVDDGSVDDTVEMVRKMNDPQIRVIASEHLGHLGMLRNIGAKDSKGEWLSFLDSDDVWVPRKLELQMQQLEKDQCRWSYGELELMDDNKKTIVRATPQAAPLSGWVTRDILTDKTEITIIAVLIEKKLFNEVGGFTSDRSLFCREDHDLIMRTSQVAEISVVPQVLVRVRVHSNRTTNGFDNSHERSAQVFKVFMQKHAAKEFKKLARKQWTWQLSEAAVRRFAGGHYGIAVKQLGKALWNGDSKRHWLSALKRGLYAIFKKHPHTPAKKGKTENAAAYHT